MQRRGASGCDLLEREVRHVGTLAGVLHGERANLAIGIQVELSVFVEVACFNDAAGTEFDV